MKSTSRLLIFVMLLSARTSYSAEPAVFRVATFNVSLYGESSGAVLERLARGDDSQARHLSEIIQRVRPDVLLLNEIDYDPQGKVLNAFCEKYLEAAQDASKSPQGPGRPIEFPHRFSAPVNTGRPSGFDLSRDGRVADAAGSDGYADDCWGYGQYEGQYGMAILSKFPIDEAAVRTFQNFRWKDMPGAMLPDDPDVRAPADWYPADALREFPLSSKSHWDVPVLVNGRRVHLLASHPTPPVFDGREDRNGRRNHDELRFWADYIGPSEEAAYIYDDKGERGGLTARSAGEAFIILGDLNGDPHDGDGPAGIRRLLAAAELQEYPPPASEGAAEQAHMQGGANTRHGGPAEQDTCDPADDPGPGNLRIDYVLPSRDLQVAGSGVFWPKADDPLFRLVGVHPFPSSDHRLVWVDVEVNDPPLAPGSDAQPAKPARAEH
jgi:hypothetical protein